MTDAMIVTLRAQSLNALRQLIHHTPLALDSEGPRRHRDGSVTIRAALTSSDLVEISSAVGIEVVPATREQACNIIAMPKLTAPLRERAMQRHPSFEGGTIAVMPAGVRVYRRQRARRKTN